MFGHFRKTQSIIQWKEVPSGNSAVPTWSRPLTNGANNAANNTTTGIINAFRARPIKHWRKQLQPASNSGQTGVGMPMDRPGGSVYLGTSINDCSSCTTSMRLPEYILTDNNINNTCATNCISKNARKKTLNYLWNGNADSSNNIYYADRKAYLYSRCLTYDQKLSTIRVSGSTANDPTRQTLNCLEGCTTTRAATTIYKPNNKQYSQQGAVSSSSRIVRLKYNTITDNGNSFTSAYGAAGANAGRYQGTSESPYFIKSKEQRVCVPFRRNGHKQIYCGVVGGGGCLTYENISITDLDVTDIGEGTYTLNSNTTITECQILTIENGQTLIVPSGKIITINGSVEIQSGGTFYATNGGEIINNSVNTIIIRSGGQFIATGTNSKITNNGTIIQYIGSTFGPTYNGTIINSSTGRMTIGGTFQSQFSATIINNGTITQTGGEISAQFDSTITNSITGSITQTGGVFRVDGSGCKIINNNTIDIFGLGLTAANQGEIENNSRMTIINLLVTAANSKLTNNGTITQTGGNFQTQFSGTITNNGTIAQTGGNFDARVSSTITNSSTGTIKVSGAGTIAEAVGGGTFTNNSSGIIYVYDNGSLNGIINNGTIYTGLALSCGLPYSVTNITGPNTPIDGCPP